MGAKASLGPQICEIAGIAPIATEGHHRTSSRYGRLGWTEYRHNEGKEYSHIGIFDVFLPFDYEEGQIESGGEEAESHSSGKKRPTRSLFCSSNV
jgi:hypothetical protein